MAILVAEARELTVVNIVGQLVLTSWANSAAILVYRTKSMTTRKTKGDGPKAKAENLQKKEAASEKK